MHDLDLLPFRYLLDEIVQPARRHFRKMILPVAVPLMAANLIMLGVQMGWMRTLGSDASSVDELFAGFGTMFGIAMILMLGYALAFCALTAGAAQALVDDDVSMARAWRFVCRPSVLGTLILVGAACAVSIVMCFLPALWVVPVLSLVIPVMVVERRYGLAAISRSVELIHFNPSGRVVDSGWLQMLSVLFVGTIVNYAVSIVVQMPFIIVQQVLLARETFSGGGGDPIELMNSILWIQVPAVLIGSVVSAVAWLYWAFGISLLYREIRRRWEGRDLEAAIDALIGDDADEIASPPSPEHGPADGAFA